MNFPDHSFGGSRLWRQAENGVFAALRNLLGLALGLGCAFPLATRDAQAVPVPVPLEGVQSVSLGYEHTCAITSVGGVKCWGNGQSGRLGNGQEGVRLWPVDVIGLDVPVVQIATGMMHSCALLGGGQVRCWGSNDSGQLGVAALSSSFVPIAPQGLPSDITQIALGAYHSCALSPTSGLKCWGSNGWGQLGDGNSGVINAVPVDVLGLSSGVVQVTAGYHHTCALLSGGGVKCWGKNEFGRLGDGTTANRPTPTDVVNLGGVAASITAGGEHTCAVLVGGAAKCWGYNYYGQIGNGSGWTQYSPTSVFGLASGVARVAAAADHTCALLDSGAVKCWGSNFYGQMGDGSPTYSAYLPQDVSALGTGAIALATGGDGSCARVESGKLKCWGRNDAGQLGSGGAWKRNTPLAVVGLASGVSRISPGSSHVCAVTNAGGAKCWGSNYSGRLGTGSANDEPEPADVLGLSTGVSSVVSGTSHSCALTTLGGVKCWGSNSYGELGNGTTTGSPTPVDVIGLGAGVIALVSGNAHSCALLLGGGAKCWGSNFAGELGDGTNTHRSTPVDVVGLPAPVSALAASSHSCAVLVTGAIWCWGANNFGKLGNGSTLNSALPVQVMGLGGEAIKVAAGNLHSCALTAVGGVKCWGHNEWGQLGDRSELNSLVPVDVYRATAGFRDLSTKGDVTCAIDAHATAKCWGKNDLGDGGDGLLYGRRTPSRVVGLESGSASVSVGGAVACAVGLDSQAYCWGYNDFGQLGDGTGGGRVRYPTYVVISATYPNQPSVGTLSPGDGSVSLTFDLPSYDGGAAIDAYRVTCEPGGISATGLSSPIVVTGLTNGVLYECTAASHNAVGWSGESLISNAVFAAIAAKVQRAFVSPKGTDANAGVGCPSSAPCASATVAETVLHHGGEVIFAESGEYPPFTLTKSVTVLAPPGVSAAISVSSGSGVVANTEGQRVVLRGLHLRGGAEASGTKGIAIGPGVTASVENCSLEGFKEAGVLADGGSLRVIDTVVRNSQAGITGKDGASLEVVGARLFGNTTGIYILGQGYSSKETTASVTKTQISGSSTGLNVYAQYGSRASRARVRESRIVGGGTGVSATSFSGGAASILLTRSAIVGSRTRAVHQYPTGPGAERVTVYSAGDNVFVDNASISNAPIITIPKM